MEDRDLELLNEYYIDDNIADFRKIFRSFNTWGGIWGVRKSYK